jgi:hypothetical protein
MPCSTDNITYLEIFNLFNLYQDDTKMLQFLSKWLRFSSTLQRVMLWHVLLWIQCHVEMATSAIHVEWFWCYDIFGFYSTFFQNDTKMLQFLSKWLRFSSSLPKSSKCDMILFESWAMFGMTTSAIFVYRPLFRPAIFSSWLWINRCCCDKLLFNHSTLIIYLILVTTKWYLFIAI